MKKTLIFGIVFVFLVCGFASGEITEDKCNKIKDCIDFLWHKVASECTYSNIPIYSEKCKEAIKKKYPKDYLKIENCRALIRNYGREYANKCSFIDEFQNNISKDECEKSMRDAQENEKYSPYGYWIEYVWTGKVCGEVGMCDHLYKAYKKVIEFREYDQEVERLYLEIVKCYDIWHEDSNKIKKIYKEFADTVYKFGIYPEFKYEKAANLYLLAEDYENACKSCQEANKYYAEYNISLIDCKKYKCKDTESKTSERLKQDYDSFLAIAIILLTITLSLFVIWYKKFKR